MVKKIGKAGSIMSIFNWFQKTDAVTVASRKEASTVSPDTGWLQREVDELKQHVQVLSTRKRVSKKQRQELLARVFSALDSAETALKRTSYVH